MIPDNRKVKKAAIVIQVTDVDAGVAAEYEYPEPVHSSRGDDKLDAIKGGQTHE